MKSIFNKIVLAGVILLTTSGFFTQAAGQTSDVGFQKGRHAITVGYGVGNLTKTYLKVITDLSDSKFNPFTGPIHFRYEYAITDHWGLGLSANFFKGGASWTSTDIQGVGTKVTMDIVGYSALARVNYHFSPGGVFDPYVGMGVGLKGWNVTFSSPQAEKDVDLSFNEGTGAEFVIGARLHFSRHIGAYTEVGIAKSIVQGGLCITF